MRVAVILLIATLAMPALAEERRLDASEIERLLTANTVFGTTEKGSFRHFFSRNGKTSFNPPDGEERVGQWRVDEANDRLEIRWRRGDDWIPMTVFIDKDGNVTLAEDGGPRRSGTVMNTRGIE